MGGGLHHGVGHSTPGRPAPWHRWCQDSPTGAGWCRGDGCGCDECGGSQSSMGTHVPSCATDPQLSPLCPVQVAQHPHGLPIPALPLAGHWPHSCRGGAFAPLNLSLQRAFLCWVLGSPRTAYTHPSRPGPLCLAVAPQPGWVDCRLRLQGGISASCHASHPRRSPWGGERRVNPELRGAVRWFDQIALSLLCLSH